jgi:hypothetical protein
MAPAVVMGAEGNKSEQLMEASLSSPWAPNSGAALTRQTTTDKQARYKAASMVCTLLLLARCVPCCSTHRLFEKDPGTFSKRAQYRVVVEDKPLPYRGYKAGGKFQLTPANVLEAVAFDTSDGGS